MGPDPEIPTYGNREEVYGAISLAVSNAEEAFTRQFGRSFDPTKEEDYVDMAPFCVGKFAPEAGASNIGVVFLRSYILRNEDILQGLECKADLVDGLIGWLNCNPPPREFEQRVQALQRLTPEDWEQIKVEHLQELTSLASIVHQTQAFPTLWKDPMRHDECTEAGHLCSYLREGSGYLFGDLFRAYVEDGLEPAEIGRRQVAHWRGCVELYSEPGNANYT